MLSREVTFGKPIANRQAIKFKLADMEIKLQTARAQLFYNAQLIDKGIYDGMLGSVTKTCVSEMVFDVANQALQIFGGYGYSREYPVEKLLKRCKGIFSLFEGTNEIQRMIIVEHWVPKREADNKNEKKIRGITMLWKEYEDVLLERKNNVATILLNNPANMNPVTASTMDHLVDALVM